MRYVSDFRVGKVNPKHFDFGLDVEAKKYDLPEFLQKNVVDAKLPGQSKHHWRTRPTSTWMKS
jgi:hypothetical protein